MGGYKDIIGAQPRRNGQAGPLFDSDESAHDCTAQRAGGPSSAEIFAGMSQTVDFSTLREAGGDDGTGGLENVFTRVKEHMPKLKDQ